MLTSEGYSIRYEPKNNRIVVDLPQTITTLTNTVAMVSNRRTHITTDEEMIILQVVKSIMERKEE